MRSSIASALVAAVVSVSASLAAAAELVMVEQPGCVWCERWDAEVAPIYPKTEEGERAPLRRLDISQVGDEIAVASRVVFTPTFLLVEDGRELARMEGYAGDEFFWVLLKQMLDQHAVEGKT